MKPKIAVFGAGSIGDTIAADLTFAGYEVNLLELPEFDQRIEDIQKLGGIQLSGDPHALISRRTGFAKPNMITTDVEAALKDVNVIFVDVPETDYETRIKAIAPYLKDEQVVNFQTYGYWPSLRVASILKQMSKENVILTESPAPMYWCSAKNGHAKSTLIRRRVPLAAFPGKKNSNAIAFLKPIFPSFEMAKNVLQTNFENINMTIHLGIALLNMGSFDRAEQRNEKFNFYTTGNTVHTGILEEQQDIERMAVCQAYKVPYTSLKEHIIRYYGSEGGSVYEAIHNCRPYHDIGWLIDFNYLLQCIGRRDIPLSLVPFVRLAHLAGVSTPIARALIELFGVIFQIDFWHTGLTLKGLGLEGLTIEELTKYVMDGEK